MRDKATPPDPTTEGATGAVAADETRTNTSAKGADAPAIPPRETRLPVVDPSNYEVEGVHGRGGLGRVLRAHDLRLDRTVAVKELLDPAGPNAERFLREARITARLQHPSIVPIHEVGRWPTGEPFYAMKLIAGRTLKELIGETKTLDDRIVHLPKLIAVADAVAYAHSRGVVHRDLKPSNVVVGEFGETVVIDWGLAKELSGTGDADDRSVASPDADATRVGTVVGTPAYMPPEQAAGEPVDERADVYALGAMLYHLLGGERPYRETTETTVLSAVRAAPPTPLEQLVPTVPRDLAAIVTKAMARSQAARYPNASEFAEDLRRFQAGQLVGAHEYSSLTRLARWVRRHRAVISVGAASLAAIAVLGTLSIRRIISERNHAMTQRQAAEARSEALLIQAAHESLATDPTATIAWLKAVKITPQNASRVADLAAVARERGVARRILHGRGGRVMTISHDGQFLFVSDPGPPEVIDLSTGKTIRTFGGTSSSAVFVGKANSLLRVIDPNHLEIDDISASTSTPVGDVRGTVNSIAETRDGTKIVIAGSEGDLLIYDAIAKNIAHLDSRLPTINMTFFSLDGVDIVSTSDHVAGVIRRPGDVRFHLDSGELLCYAAPLPDETYLLVGIETIRVWTPTTNRIETIDRRRQGCGNQSQLASNADGSLIAFVTANGNATIWSTRTHRTIGELQFSTAAQVLAFSPTGSTVAIAEHSGDIHFVDAPSATEVENRRGHHDIPALLAFSGDGRTMVSVGLESDLRVWDVGPDSHFYASREHDSFHLSLSPDGRFLATIDRDSLIHVIDAQTSVSRTLDVQGTIVSIGFLSDSRHIISVSTPNSNLSEGTDAEIVEWDFEADRAKRSILHGSEGWTTFRSSKDYSVLAVGRADGTLQILWPTTGTSRDVRVGVGEITNIELADDGSMILVAETDGSAFAVNPLDLSVRLIGVLRNRAFYMAISSNRVVAASSFLAPGIVAMDLATGTSRHVDTESPIWGLVFSPDGHRLLAGDSKGQVLEWRLSDDRLTVLSIHDSSVRPFMKNGLLMLQGSSGELQVYDLNDSSTLSLQSRGGGQVSLSGDGRQVALLQRGGVVLLDLNTAPWVPDDSRRLLPFLRSITSAELDDLNLDKSTAAALLP